jgi:hypothetical protein
VTHAVRAAGGGARTASPWRWAALALAAATIFSSYYEADAIGPIADLLVRQRAFTQSQIGDLTAVISLPTILLAVLNGVLSTASDPPASFFGWRSSASSAPS